MSAAVLAEGEVEREARRIFRKLMLPGAQLVPSDNGAYAVRTMGKRECKRRLRVPATLAAEFRRRDWIVPDTENSGCFLLSAAGQGWIKRALATADPFAAQHRLEGRRVLAEPGGETRIVAVNDAESPLAWLFRRRGPDGQPLISETQFRAGEKLRRDFSLAQLEPRLGVDLSAPVVAGRRGAKSEAPLPEIVLAAKQRFAKALAAVGPGLSDILIDVCCHLNGLEGVERQHRWPQRSAKIVLHIGLDRLAAHYGMPDGTGERKGSLRVWRAPEDDGKDTPREP